MKRLFILILLPLVFSGCKKLDEKVLDEALNTELLTGPGTAQGVLVPVYARMSRLLDSYQDYFQLQEISTDEAIVPYRGGTDWYNGGVMIEMQQHNYTATHSSLATVFNNINQGTARAAIAIYTLNNLTDANKELYIAEARGMGAFYNSMLFELFGVCIYKDPASVVAGTGQSEVYRGQQAIDFLIKELDAVAPTLKNKSEVGAGRLTKGAVLGLKAKIFLNRAVYLNRYGATLNFETEDMNKVISYCTELIGSGNYALENSDYFKIFDINNHNHSEHIFAMNHSNDANNGNLITWFALARNQHGSLTNLQATGTDGGSITESFWNTWKDNKDDPRFSKVVIPQDGSVSSVADNKWGLNRGLLYGQQYGIVLNSTKSAFKRTANGELVIEKLFNTVKTGEAVNFSPEVDFDKFNGHSNGIRVSKNEYDPNSTNGSNYSRVDQPIIRLADIHLMRAEAYLRKGIRDLALADINAVRTARKHPRMMTDTELSLESLLRERGFELYWEMTRRTDLIRFGKYETGWTGNTNKSVDKRVFPIPQATVDANPSLMKQNQGY
ncbi:RagB/SusD family nutrient uptake outer membrane protein [Pedobacter hiemivivus]|uniref:RagB/SusD family nutrient uptake outer membrane protein n=1 Tax=Pedobacter hiemivivus TaxID=2530454 RepID=A0A4R0NG47_9SPHI|nr:RagB/SusD family nutrient uptake outer membrane protein [Pedobacter hiemivivus]TCC99138.1 RagB/SusD family nutrient uptake outer membrane protein [Pedobacter hiemivivus]